MAYETSSKQRCFFFRVVLQSNCDNILKTNAAICVNREMWDLQEKMDFQEIQ